MNTIFASNQPIGEIVAHFPTAGLVFKKHRIDFCCGGDRSLSVAIEAKGLDEATIVAELNEAFLEAERRKERSTDWNSVEYPILVDHIINTHHAYLKKELGGLGEFVHRIRNVHGLGHPELIRLNELYGEVRRELEEHMAKEEAQIFPFIKQYAKSGERDKLTEAVAAIDVLEAEHSVVGDLLSEMRDLTADYTLPPDACATYTVSFQKLIELEDDMFQHIHLENNILFTRLEKELSSHA